MTTLVRVYADPSPAAVLRLARALEDLDPPPRTVERHTDETGRPVVDLLFDETLDPEQESRARGEVVDAVSAPDEQVETLDRLERLESKLDEILALVRPAEPAPAEPAPVEPVSA